MSIRKHILMSTLDQALLSASNFIVGVYLIKSVGKLEYGTYVLGYAVVLLLVGVQNALVSTQMIVLSPYKDSATRRRFCGSLAVGQYCIFIPLVILGVCGAVVAYESGFMSASDKHLSYAIGIAILGTLLREFYRAYFFITSQIVEVIIIDVLYVTLLLSGLFLADFPAESLHLIAIGLLGVASFVAGSVAAFLSKVRLCFKWKEMILSLGEVWPQGRWSLGGVAVTWIQDQSYVYLLSAMGGRAATADASASRLFFAPLALLNTGFTRVLMPRWAELWRIKDIKVMKDIAFKVKAIFTILIVGYVSALLMSKDVVTNWVLTAEYSDLSLLIILWGVVFLVQVIRSNYASMLQVLGAFRSLTIANLASATVVISIGTYLIAKYGAAGSVTALIVGELVLTFLLAIILNKAVGNVHAR